MSFIEITVKNTGKKSMVNLGDIIAVIEMPKPSGPLIRVRDCDSAVEVVEDYAMVRAMIRDITDAKITHDYTWKPEHD